MVSGVRFVGIDFTSTPTKRKPVVAAFCRLTTAALELESLQRWHDMSSFEAFLGSAGTWCVGIDCPLGQARRFADNLGPFQSWPELVSSVCAGDRAAFRQRLEDYKRERPAGDKHHKRLCDRRAASQSPQTLFGTPVGLMFYEAAPRLLSAGVHLPMHHDGDKSRVVFEAYPGVAARALIGKKSYKSDYRGAADEARFIARKELAAKLADRDGYDRFGFRLPAALSLVEDPGGDSLDAIIAAAQAAWGWQQGFAFANRIAHDPIEGWIVDPDLPPG